VIDSLPPPARRARSLEGPDANNSGGRTRLQAQGQRSVRRQSYFFCDEAGPRAAHRPCSQVTDIRLCGSEVRSGAREQGFIRLIYWLLQIQVADARLRTIRRSVPARVFSFAG